MNKSLKDYFIPHEGNEYKPHIMRKTSLAIISLIAVLIFGAGTLNVILIQKTDILSAVISQTLVDLANTDRTQNQIAGLTVSPLLVKAAQDKADDMAKYGYFAHTSPQGKSPWYWFDAVGYDYQYAGENLAVNFSDSSAVNTAWMGSPEHRANILNGKFTEIGIATSHGVLNGQDTIFVVQLFGKPQPGFSSFGDFVNQAVSSITHQNNNIASNTPTVAGIAKPVSKNKSSTPASKASDTVLGESNSFVSVENNNALALLNAPASSNTPQSVQNNSAKAPIVATIVTSPQKTVSVLYIVLLIFVTISLLLMVFIEIKRQHPKLIALGLCLIILIILLAYIYRTVLFGQVLVM